MKAFAAGWLAPVCLRCGTAEIECPCRSISREAVFLIARATGRCPHGTVCAAAWTSRSWLSSVLLAPPADKLTRDAVAPPGFVFTLMTFGLFEDHHHTRVPLDRLVEANPRLDVWHLLQCGGLVEGATTRLQWGEKGCLVARRTPDIWIDGTRIPVTWDEPMPGVCRPWFLCGCGRRCRHVYFRDVIACSQCHSLKNASRHLRRQTPGVGRVERLRRKLGNCDVRPFAPLPARRRGRSRAYHEKLVAMIHAEEAKLLGHLNSVVHDLDRRIRVRKAKGKW